MIFYFRLIYFFSIFFFFWYFRRYVFLVLWPAIKKFRHENWKSFRVTFCRIQCRFQNCLFLFLALIVFDFYSFEGLKTHFTGEANMYICIYWVLLGGFKAINASNQGTLCSFTIFQPSCFILYSIFSMNLAFFYEIFYNDVTTLLWRHLFFDRS